MSVEEKKEFLSGLLETLTSGENYYDCDICTRDFIDDLNGYDNLWSTRKIITYPKKEAALASLVEHTQNKMAEFGYDIQNNGFQSELTLLAEDVCRHDKDFAKAAKQQINTHLIPIQIENHNRTAHNVRNVADGQRGGMEAVDNSLEIFSTIISKANKKVQRNNFFENISACGRKVVRSISSAFTYENH